MINPIKYVSEFITYFYVICKYLLNNKNVCVIYVPRIFEHILVRKHSCFFNNKLDIFNGLKEALLFDKSVCYKIMVIAPVLCVFLFKFAFIFFRACSKKVFCDRRRTIWQMNNCHLSHVRFNVPRVHVKRFLKRGTLPSIWKIYTKPIAVVFINITK